MTNIQLLLLVFAVRILSSMTYIQLLSILAHVKRHGTPYIIKVLQQVVHADLSEKTFVETHILSFKSIFEQRHLKFSHKMFYAHTKFAISKFALKYQDHVLLLPSSDSTQNEAASPITYIAKLVPSDTYTHRHTHTYTHMHARTHTHTHTQIFADRTSQKQF